MPIRWYPGPHWRSLQCSPRPYSWTGEGDGGEGRGIRDGRTGREVERERVEIGKWMNGSGPKFRRKLTPHVKRPFENNSNK